MRVTADPLQLEECTAFVTDPGAGAISTFIGTTRDNFQGRDVLYLEYEAYEPMAVKELQVGKLTIGVRVVALLRQRSHRCLQSNIRSNGHVYTAQARILSG